MEYKITSKPHEAPRHVFTCDSEATIKVNTNICCGIKELSSVHLSCQKEKLESDLLDICRICVNSTAFVLFSAVHRPAPYMKYGDALGALIEKEGLGTVWKSKVTKNPNSNNDLAAYVWTLNREAIQAWLARKDGPPIEDQLKEGAPS